MQSYIIIVVASEEDLDLYPQLLYYVPKRVNFFQYYKLYHLYSTWNAYKT